MTWKLYEQSFDELKEIFQEEGKFLFTMQKGEKNPYRKDWGLTRRKLVLTPLANFGYRFRCELKKSFIVILNGLSFIGVTRIELNDTEQRITLFYENYKYEQPDYFDFEELTTVEVS